MNNMQVTEPIVTRAPEPDWSGWEKWLRSHLDIERELVIEACGEALGITRQELRDRISALELKLAELTGAVDILRGTTTPPERDTRALGELLSTERREFGDLLERRTRGFELKLAELSGAVDILRGLQPPPPAKFPVIDAWRPDTIYHEGAIVAYDGGTWQATRDTGKAPGTKDWVALAVAGRDGRTPRVRGTYSADATYQTLDLVMRESSSFIATRDDPGPCPGDGWQIIACGGKRGAAGEKGERGPPGPRGDAGASGVTIHDWKIDREKYLATPLMSDGRDGPPLELLGLFQQFFADVQK
jgi:hypothetical protein